MNSNKAQKKNFKKRVYVFLHEYVLFIKFIYVLIVLNVISIVLESYKELAIPFYHQFYWFECFSVAVFTLEYLLRLWTIEYHYKSIATSVLKKRVKYLYSIAGLIDLLSILPFYLPLFFHFDLRVLRILRLFRLFRIFKLGRFSKSLKTIHKVIKESKPDLMITFFTAIILLVLSSTLMYYIENEAQPDKFKNIGEALWWSIVTLTTVGYGDMYPITFLGKLLSACIAVIGIGFVALPTGIISAAFMEEIRISKIKKTEKEDSKCDNKHSF